MKRSNLPFLVPVILLVIALAGFAIYYIQANSAIAAANNTANTLGQQVAILQSQLQAANLQSSAAQTQLSTVTAQLYAAKSQLSSANATAASYKDNVASYQSQITAIQGNITSYQSQMKSLQDDVSSYKSQVTSLQDQVTLLNDELKSTANANVVDLQNQVSTLMQQVQSLEDVTKLNSVSVKADLVSITQGQTQNLKLVSFTADYAGYVVVAGQSSSPDTFINLQDSFTGYPLNDYKYPFGANTSLVIPVLPGQIDIYFYNSVPGAVATAVVTIKYYY